MTPAQRYWVPRSVMVDASSFLRQETDAEVVLAAAYDRLLGAIEEFIEAEHRASVRNVTDTTESLREARHRYERAHSALFKIARPNAHIACKAKE